MKLTSNLKKHLMKIAESFAKDQQVNGQRQFEKKYEAMASAFKQEMEEKYKDQLKKVKEYKATYDKAYAELCSKLNNDNADIGTGTNNIYLTSAKRTEIQNKINANANIQWDVILSSVALRLELCATFEDAKQVIQEVTGANIDTMMATIIPPNLQLTNNNN